MNTAELKNLPTSRDRHLYSRRCSAPAVMAFTAVTQIALGCAPTAENLTQSTFIDVLATTSRLSLEETDDVINVSISVRSAQGNTFLVTDASEAQVRLYDGTGALLTYFGRRGDGPGELQDPTVAVRLNSGDIFVANLVSRASIFSANGDSIKRTIAFPFGPVYDVDVLSESRLLISGEADNYDGRLHVWDMTADSVVTSFLSPRLPPEFLPAIRLVGLTSAVVRGDTIAAVFALSDTLYLFHGDGRSIAKLPIHSRHVRPLTTPPPIGPGRQSEVRDWVDSFSMFADVHWPVGSNLIIQYQDRVDLQPKWRLLGLSLATGRTTFEIVDTPRLLATTEAPDTSLIFVDPNSMTPNKWILGRLLPR